ncbi:MAG: DUF4412 domain-containing protein [Candidatus Aminicenantes bacterium]
MRIKFIKGFITALALLMFFGCPSNSNADAEGFTADMIQKVDNRTIEGKLFVQGTQHRMDLEENGEKLSILVDRKSGKTTIVIHSQKAAREIANTSLQSLSNNPFESYKTLIEKHSSREKGSEVINGYECKEIEIYEEDQNLMTAWVSDKLDWPVKISLQVEPSRETELKNIKEKNLEEDLFQVPEGYKLSPMRETKKEEAPVKEQPEETEDLTASKNAVFKKLEEKGIEQETEDGTIKLAKVETSTLTECFPGWHFFRVTREKEIQGGGTSFGYISVEKAAVSKDNKNVYILDSPGTSMPLNEGLTMLQNQGITLNNKEDVEKLGDALTTIYYRDSKVEGVESLGENEWVIYNGTSFGKPKGFIVKVGSNGEITELNYKLKIKEK